MATDADAPDGEMSNAETREQPLSGADSLSTAHRGADAQDAEEHETVAADSDDLAVAGKAEGAKSAERRMLSPVLQAMLVGLVVVLALGGVAGWSGFRTYQLRADQQRRELFLRVGRQAAVNLTTIDWQNVNSDIQRILDSATGPFYDDFSKRSEPFIEVVKTAQSKSVGTVTEAGLESSSTNEARVLVAVTVKTSNLGATEQPLRAWRMRIDLQKVDNGAKVSNVLFVPS